MKNAKVTSLIFKKSIIDEIVNTIGRYPPETGGILGANSSGIISYYYYDRTGKSTVHGYAPDVSAINKMLTEEWMPAEIFMVGIVHSHSNMNGVPSCGDISYGVRILQALDTVDEFYLPIVTQSERGFEMFCYVICRDPERQYICKKTDYTVIDE